MTSFDADFLKAEWVDYYGFLESWVEAFDTRRVDRRNLMRKVKQREKKQEALKKAERKAKDEDYMRPDAKMAKKDLGSKRARALEDLSWIDVKVDINFNKEE